MSTPSGTPEPAKGRKRPETPEPGPAQSGESDEATFALFRQWLAEREQAAKTAAAAEQVSAAQPAPAAEISAVASAEATLFDVTVTAELTAVNSSMETHLPRVRQLIAEAKTNGREHYLALGFASWQDWLVDRCEQVFPAMPDLVADAMIPFLLSEGLSQRAVSRATGVPKTTVERRAQAAKAGPGAPRGVPQVRATLAGQVIRLLTRVQERVDDIVTEDLAQVHSALLATTKVVASNLDMRARTAAA
jgi:hypothetical protein